MSTDRLPQAERERAHRNALAVHAFVRAGVLPLLAAAGATTPTGITNPETMAAIAALRGNARTRAALDGAVLDIQRTYEAGKVAWDAGREREAAAHFERARRASIELFRTMQRAVPAAAQVLRDMVANLGDAIFEGFTFGGLLGLAVLFVALKAVSK
jgi:hypothetical protein